MKPEGLQASKENRMRHIFVLFFVSFLSTACLEKGGGDDTGDVPVDADGDGHTADVDCDDTEAGVNPEAEEVCNGVDDNCDEIIDTDAVDAPLWYADADGDGYGDAEVTELACEAPSDFVADATDCDDAAVTVSPGGEEVCDGIDNDCNTLIDESSATDALPWYADQDGDGFGDPNAVELACETPGTGYLSDNTDCDDAASGVFPGAEETCDGVDNNCDSFVDEDAATDALTFYADADADGYGDSASTLDNCDAVAPSGYVASSDDCDDQATAVNPGATEVCDALDTDEDCSGAADDNDPGVTGTTMWYPDADGDGFGDDTDAGQALCEQPSGTVSDNTDCNDDPNNGGADQYPGNTDIPQNGIDEDCSGSDALNGVSDLTTGDLVITEVMADPLAVNNSDGEWFEIYNATADDVDLDGLVVSSTISTPTSFTVSGTVSLASGGYVVFGNNADAATNGGVTVDYEYVSSFSNLVNGGDDLTLNNGSIDIDSVSWECGGFRSAPGAAMALDVSLLTATDNDIYDSWCDADTDIGSGDFGTPGAANAACSSGTPTYSYASDIHTLWSTNTAASCTGCHGSNGGLTLSGSSSSTYTALTTRVDAGCHETSLIWLRLSGTSAGEQMPKNASSTFSQSELDMISTWIDEGMNP